MTKVLAMVAFLYYPLSVALWSILCFMPLALSPAVLSGGVLCSSAYAQVLSLVELCLSKDFGLLQPLLFRVFLHCTLG